MGIQRLAGRLVALVVIGVCAVGVAALADCPEFLSAVDTPGEAVGIAVAGSYAYVADGVQAFA